MTVSKLTKFLTYREERRQVDDMITYFMNTDLPEYKYEGSNDQNSKITRKPAEIIKVKLNKFYLYSQSRSQR